MEEKKLRILVVEDFITQNKSHWKLKPTLTWAFGDKAIVDAVGKGEEAIELLRNKHYDVAFLEYKMSGMNGPETAIKLREISEKIRLIGFSDWTEEDAKKAGLEAYFSASESESMSDYISQLVEK